MFQKKEGGLGLKKKDWNQVAIIKHIWIFLQSLKTEKFPVSQSYSGVLMEMEENAQA